VQTAVGRAEPASPTVAALADALGAADRPLLVCGPADPAVSGPGPETLARFVEATGAPVLADPLSGHRFGAHVPDLPVCGGYDSYLDAGGWPDPDLVVRCGASPTSKTLRQYLRDADARQVLVDPAGGWREAEFTATDLVVADPTPALDSLADALDDRSLDRDNGGDAGEGGVEAWRDRFVDSEDRYWSLVGAACRESFFEGTILREVARSVPDPATLFVSNSMPVRDLDRFGRPRDADLAVLGNRGVSGVDGVTSTAMGAGSATDDPLVLVTGDLAYYHDMNGLLALGRCGVDATIVLVNNDGGGIFHMLPIESFDPPFTEQFRTPHGLDFGPTGELYDLEFGRVEGRSAFVDALEAAVGSAGTRVIEVQTDARSSHRTRERLHERVCERLG
jgi:2-succinyl-5-enolpyruvyl-6-hydroxy-3-cyclohexene-1-carboxylate synthase